MTVFYIFKITDPKNPQLIEALNIAYDNTANVIEFWQLFRVQMPSGVWEKEPHLMGSGKIISNKCELNKEYTSAETRKTVTSNFSTLIMGTSLPHLTAKAKGTLINVREVNPRTAEFMYRQNYVESGSRPVSRFVA